ncbi:ATP-binding protein [Nannocystis pusilla]|uniref:ATP-binding protein n=1 Tax=Nannocystis pusilla TaxID=889268 RepID=UPI003B7687B3
MVHCLPDFVVTSDLDGVVLTINREVPGIPTDQLVGRPESMFTPIAPDERPALRQRFAHVVKTGETLTYETQVLYPDNTYGTFESRLGPIFDGGRITGTVLVTRDLTRQRQAEEARRAAEQQIREYTIQLERSNRELERFASVASHDLQEPLRKIQAFGDRLRQKYEELLPEAGRDYVQRMQEAAKRMQDLINDLLMFSRLTTKEQRHAPVNLNKILTAVLSDLEVRIEENEAKIEAEGLPMLEADPMHMRQLFQNLISNAIKFRRPEHAPVVKITAEELPAHGRATSMVMRVSDNGIGIDAKYHERIFGIFERLHSRGKYEGTGVGLAVCRKICEQHGGAIRVESNPDAGSTFIVELPLRQEEAPVPMKSNSKRPITILIADDDPEDRMLAAEALKESRLANDIRFVEDGEELLDYLLLRGRFNNPDDAPRPGVILLDLNMPRKDGREALREIKENPELRRIPIIVLTTSKAEIDIYRSYDLGVNSFIVKPVTFDSLVEVMQVLRKYWFEIVEIAAD